MKQNNKYKLLKRIPFSIAFWSVFTLVMVILFFCNRGAISKTVTKLQGAPVLQTTKNVAQEVQDIVEKKVKKNEDNLKTDNSQSAEHEKADFEAIEKKEHFEDEKIESTSAKEVKEHDEINLLQDEKDISTQNDRAQRTEEMDDTSNSNPEIQERQIEVYFATVSDSGSVNREKCVRTIARSTSPMQDSINALLKGPSKEEAKRGLRSFIPVDTRLLSASIKDGSAFLNFSEEFQFNRYGVEGYTVQLQQVVFTACSFPTVNSVQFLIEGQKRDFIGSEGIWIGSPFTPSSF